MKKTISALLSLVMVLSILLGMAVPVYAEVSQRYTAGAYEYRVKEDGTAEITRYEGGGKDILVPDCLNDYTVL